MATWDEFSALAGRFGGTRLSENAWSFDLQGKGEDRVQKTFVFHETIAPDFEMLRVASAFAPIGVVDCAQVLKGFGQMHVGAIGFTPVGDPAVEGLLTLVTSIPLACLDLSRPLVFMLYLNIFAQAADNVEQRVSLPHDMF